MNKLNCLIFISGGGSNLKNIIEKIDSGFLKDINIHKVITDNPSAIGLKYAYEKKILTNIINEEYSYEDISMDISENNIDLIILAGFMKILPADFVNNHDGKIINLHPSLLPKHKGLDTHNRAIQSGDKTHGASVHFVTEKLDNGPVFIQGLFEIGESDTAATLEKKVHEMEYQILPIAIRWFGDKLIEKNGNNYNFRGTLEKEPIKYL
tara:strand:+ start:911 stop:1537 length:627 start_codon:yes stop_codon:yes gene_type:complete